MTFFDEIAKYKDIGCAEMNQQITSSQVRRALNKAELQHADFLALLSPPAAGFLEDMARAAHRSTVSNFGYTISLYTPLYLANYCVNHCVYCGFQATHDIERRKLTLPEVEKEAKAIAASGLKHILILTGESRVYSPVSYIRDCVTILKKYFPSISIEIYPLNTDEYIELIAAGVDGLTVFQEVYDAPTYDKLHPQGPKRDYRFRLEAPDRAGEAGIRTITIGPLLGLADWRSEVFFAGLHAKYLQNRFPDAEIGISFPRMRPQFGDYQPESPVSDSELVQIILAFRLFLPRVGITLSTRESAEFRDNLLKLGITKMSAGSSTVVGGHTDAVDAVGQFEINDHRSVPEMRASIAKLGYKPVLQDWHDLN